MFEAFFKLFLNIYIYIPVLAISFVLHINLIHKVWVDLINERQQEPHILFSKKSKSYGIKLSQE